MKHIFQAFWHGGELSPYEGVCLRSFVENGHVFRLYSYNANLAVPAGVELCDAGEILKPNKWLEQGRFALFSDLFRYKLLYEKGGWWVDTDVVCLSNSIPEQEFFFAWEDDERINGAILHFPALSPIMRHCFDISVDIGDSGSWGIIGPDLLTKTLTEFNLAGRALRAKYAYPVHWRDACDLLLQEQCTEIDKRCEEAWFLHLWNEVFRRKRIHKWALPPRDSFLYRLTQKHPVSGWTSAYDEALLSAHLGLLAAFERLEKRERKRLPARLERAYRRMWPFKQAV